jgi:hypothetical protein
VELVPAGGLPPLSGVVRDPSTVGLLPTGAGAELSGGLGGWEVSPAPWLVEDCGDVVNADVEPAADLGSGTLATGSVGDAGLVGDGGRLAASALSWSMIFAASSAGLVPACAVGGMEV